MNKAQSKECPWGRPKGFKNKPKALTTAMEGDTTINTPTNANAKEAIPSKEPKPAKEPKSERINQNILRKPNGREVPDWAPIQSEKRKIGDLGNRTRVLLVEMESNL
ncbi:hypothetical protein B0H14DRAFT_2584461 [Mycena olivaceomarginata]|nr:hypothetical protein B0H14DRAFT_2584461 [Mycena olivaceomarginata]